MVINVQIPKPLLDAVDRKAHALKMDRDDLIVRVLEKEMAPGADWSPELFEKLSATDSETVAAVDELLVSVRAARTSKSLRGI